VVAELLRYLFGTALAAEFMDGRGDGISHLTRAGIIGTLQRRHEQGVGPEGADVGVLHR
jgi:hypothetical protein